MTVSKRRNTMEMYEVCAKCGHVGRKYYIDKVFAVKAESAKEAAAIARQIPRVKHDHKDAIRYVKKIDEERFLEIIRENEADPYLHCKNRQEQDLTCELELQKEIEEVYNIKEFKVRPTYYKKQLIRNPRRYMNNYVGKEDRAI